jgi:chromosome segregation ATPase
MAVERWTDAMLDGLASSVVEIKDSVSELRDSVSEIKDSVSELRDSVSEIRDGVDGLRITAQALLQVAAQNQQQMNRFEQEIELMKQRQAETDQRFNILLEELRYLIRGNQEN